jgi:undecaprenyl pyrophosphate phosphatase UppP
MDPFRVILNLAQQSGRGLHQTLAILPVIIKSGVTISSSFFNEIQNLIHPTNFDFLQQSKTFLRSLTLCLWVRSLGRQDLQLIIASIHARLSTHISNCLKNRQNLPFAYVIPFSVQFCVENLALLLDCQ